jgi:hypothetical protein
MRDVDKGNDHAMVRVSRSGRPQKGEKNVMRNVTLQYGSLVAGIQKRFANTTSLSFANATYAPSELVKLIQSVIDAVNATAPAKAKWQNTVKSARSIAAPARPVVRAFVAYLRALYGTNTEALADFGLAPAKVGKPKVVTKANALAQSKATRAVRHTMGKRQRKVIKGTAPAVPATPATPAGGTTTTKS